jgi:hypothetical protein
MGRELRVQISDFKNIFGLPSDGNRTDTHWVTMASENPTLKNRGTETLRKWWQASIITTRSGD